MNKKTISQIFIEHPPHWGLRGDPYLWNELEEYFSRNAFHETTEDFEKQCELLFQQLTGFPISHRENIYIERYAHGGMSSGHVCPEFWRDKAFPLLRKRYEQCIAG